VCCPVLVCLRIRNCLTQLCAEDIAENERQEVDEALQREARWQCHLIFSPCSTPSRWCDEARALSQILAALRTDEILRAQPKPQDEMRAGMSYFDDTIWNGVPKFLRRVDTALKNIGIDERLPYDAPIIQFSSWMGGDRDGTTTMLCSHVLDHFV
jgi:phosphoenolpyruvate carboxylase